MNLPKPEMDRDAAMELWIKERSEYAKEQVVLGNIGIIGIVMKRLGLNLFDDDLYSVGIIGLVKAVNKFNPERGVKFSTFSGSVITNEFFAEFQKKRILSDISLDDKCKLKNGEELPYAEIIPGETDFENDLIFKVLINRILDGLTEKEKKIIELSFFEGKTQQEIAKEIGVSQAQVSRILNGTLKKCKKKLGYR